MPTCRRATALVFVFALMMLSLVAFAGCTRKEAGVTIWMTATATRIAGGRIHFKGRTNLPEGTVVFAETSDSQGIVGMSFNNRVYNGEFAGQIEIELKPKGSIKVTLRVAPLVGQPEALINLIGVEGEKLRRINLQGVVIDNHFTGIVALRYDLGTVALLQ